MIGDLTSRRGLVQGQDTRGNAIVIDAFVPLANMFGYINTSALHVFGPRAIHDAVRSLRGLCLQNISEEIQAKFA